MELEEDWDVIVVGAGILGISTAKTLKEKNPDHRILVVDKYSGVGQGNTGKSNACYRNIFGTQTNIILSNSSNLYYKFLQSDLSTDLEMQEFGYLWLLSEKQYQARTIPSIDFDNGEISFFDFLLKNNVDYQVIGHKELSNIIPKLVNSPKSGELLPKVNISKALYGVQCGAISPDLLVKAYETLFKGLGGITYFDCFVKEILLKEKDQSFDPDYKNTIWRDSEVSGLIVKHKGSEKILQAKKIILVTGAWINQLLDPLGINSTIKAKKRQLFRICDLKDLVFNPYFPSELDTIPFLILPVGGVFIKPIPGANCVEVGCSDDISRSFETGVRSMEIEEYDQDLDNPVGEMDFYTLNILPILQLYFPQLFDENKRVEKPGAGMYSYSPDKSPIIEKIEELGNLYFVSGASGSGIMKADAIGRISAALVNGEEYAKLYGGQLIKVSDFSLKKRNLKQESMVL